MPITSARVPRSALDLRRDDGRGRKVTSKGCRMIVRLLNSLALFWAAMLTLGATSLIGLVEGGWHYPQMMRVSGVACAQLLVATLAVTPAVMLLGQLGRRFDAMRPASRSLGRWLLVRRRHLGLGSFAFAVVHLVHYLIDTGNVPEVLLNATRLDFATGWGAVAIFAALALTSNGTAIRTLGARWKWLHRLVYPAAALAFIHWWYFDFSRGPWLYVFLALGMKAVHLVLVLRPARRMA